MKNITKATIAALGMYVLAAHAHTTGYSHEPDGFGGIHWGDPVPSWLRPSCAIVGEETVCQPEKTAPSVTMNGRKIMLDSLVYDFWRGQLTSVSIHGPKVDLELAFLARFGHATTSKVFANGTMRSYDWEGARTDILFYEGGALGSVDETRAQVNVQSVKLRNEWADSRGNKEQKSDL